MTQCVDEQIGVLPTVKSESHFVQVGLQMLGADFVPCSDDAALEQREGRFDAVRVNVSSEPDIFSGDMVHSFVLEIAYSFRVSTEVVGHNHVNILRNVLLNVPCQSSALGILGVKETQFAAPLANTNDAFLMVTPAHPLATALYSAHIGFIHFDSTIQHRAVNLSHCLADTVTEIPCGFVRPFVQAPDSTLELMSAHALLGFAQQQCGEEPDRQGQVRVMENRPAGNRELVLTAHALVASVVFQARDPRVLATWTHHALGPAQSVKQLTAAIIGRVYLINFGESHGSTS